MSGEPLLSPDSYLSLRSSQFKVPVELAKKNLRNIQRLNKKQTSILKICLKRLQEKKLSKSQKLKAIEKLISLQKSFHREIVRRARQHNEFINRLVLRAERLTKFEELVNEAGKYKKRDHTLEDQLGTPFGLFLDGNNGTSDTSGQRGNASFSRTRNGSQEYCQSIISELTQKRETRVHKLNEQIKEFLNSEIYLNVIEYLLRTSTGENFATQKEENIGTTLAKHLGLTKLIDWDVILQGITIYHRIKNHKDLKILIAWCTENEKKLKQLNIQSPKGTDLAYETSFNLFVSSIEQLQLFEAINIASNNLIGHSTDIYDDSSSGEILQTADTSSILFDRLLGPGLIYYSTIRKAATSPWNIPGYSAESRTKNNIDETDCVVKFVGFDKRQELIRSNLQMYEKQLGDGKWEALADFFLLNFNALYGLESSVPLVDLLEVGLPVLKTRYCDLYKGMTDNKGPFAEYMVPSCPICSSTFGEYHCKYSHQIVSNIFADPVLTPDGYIFSSLKLYNAALGYERAQHSNKKDNNNQRRIKGPIVWPSLSSMHVMNPLTGDKITPSNIRKVFPA